MPTRIEWCDETWNPFGWGCFGPGGSAEHPKLCSYCFAKRLSLRKMVKCPQCQAFIPHWHPEQLDRPLHWKKPRRVFCGSMCDPFGDWVTDDQLDQILDVMANCPQHTFYLLTKQPQNIMEKIYNSACRPPFIFRRSLPRNVWLGASIDTQARAQSSDADMTNVLSYGWHTFASVEPMLTAISPASLMWAEWIIIGAESGRDAAKHKPQREWIEHILNVADGETPVFLKDSITRLWPDLARQEWPV